MTILTLLRRLVSGIALAALLGAVAWAPRVLRRIDAFAVRSVEVAGAHLLAPHEVLAASGIRIGHNVWDDSRPWIDALVAHPVVHAATIERSLPRTLRVRIEERRPVALVEATVLRPATADGDLLPVDPTRAELDLPLLRPSAAAAGDPAAAAAELRPLLAEVGRLLDLDPALVARVSEVRAGAPGELRLTLGEPAIELALPVGAGDASLRRLRAVLDDLPHRAAPGAAAGGPRAPAAPVHIDLRFADQVVVRFPSSP